jgi:predicted nucleic acid-binding protein
VIVYLDTSAALKLVIEEVESARLARMLDARLADGDDVVASMLLMTELMCAAERRGLADRAGVNSALGLVSLVDLERGDLVRAATSRWGLRSADALHLATAVRLGAPAMVTYDAELAAAATRAGLDVLAPR